MSLSNESSSVSVIDLSGGTVSLPVHKTSFQKKMKILKILKILKKKLDKNHKYFFIGDSGLLLVT